MKKFGVMFLCSILAAMLCLSCDKQEEKAQIPPQEPASVTSPSTDEKAIELSYSVFFPPAHAQCKAAEEWAREIEKQSNGKVKINVFPGGTLTSANECYDGVVKGISDIGMSCFAYTRGRFPVMEAIDLPMGYPGGTIATLAANDYYAQIKPAELDDVHVLVPVAMPQGGTYEALQKGVVEGTFAPIETLKGWKQAEVIKSTTDCHMIGYTTAMFVVINKAKWEQLPENIQKIMTDASTRQIAVHGKVWDDADAEGRAFTTELKNEIIALSEEEGAQWKAAVQPVIDEYIQTAKTSGIDAEKNLAILKSAIDNAKE
ncbi:MAG: TRAP transporter substrate-binding protein [Desulfobacterales bacterium]|nr:TRAP transporter substrate-binding protein [Desulfobacterales bacterium]